MAAEGFTRLTYEIAEGKGGVTKLTVIHELEGAPKLRCWSSGGLEDTGAGGGWSWVLSDLKSLLETGGLRWTPTTVSTKADAACEGGARGGGRDRRASAPPRARTTPR